MNTIRIIKDSEYTNEHFTIETNAIFSSCTFNGCKFDASNITFINCTFNGCKSGFSAISDCVFSQCLIDNCKYTKHLEFVKTVFNSTVISDSDINIGEKSNMINCAITLGSTITIMNYSKVIISSCDICESTLIVAHGSSTNIIDGLFDTCILEFNSSNFAPYKTTFKSCDFIGDNNGNNNFNINNSIISNPRYFFKMGYDLLYPVSSDAYFSSYDDCNAERVLINNRIDSIRDIINGNPQVWDNEEEFLKFKHDLVNFSVIYKGHDFANDAMKKIYDPALKSYNERKAKKAFEEKLKSVMNIDGEDIKVDKMEFHDANKKVVITVYSNGNKNNNDKFIETISKIMFGENNK